MRNRPSSPARPPMFHRGKVWPRGWSSRRRTHARQSSRAVSVNPSPATTRSTTRPPSTSGTSPRSSTAPGSTVGQDQAAPTSSGGSISRRTLRSPRGSKRRITRPSASEAPSTSLQGSRAAPPCAAVTLAESRKGTSAAGSPSGRQSRAVRRARSSASCPEGGAGRTSSGCGSAIRPGAAPGSDVASKRPTPPCGATACGTGPRDTSPSPAPVRARLHSASAASTRPRHTRLHVVPRPTSTPPHARWSRSAPPPAAAERSQPAGRRQVAPTEGHPIGRARPGAPSPSRAC